MEDDTSRYVFQTRGVCPPEIHFRIQEDLLQEVRFVGGGCPGNALLVCRLLQGRPIGEVLRFLEGIDCRNDTSCPDQLARGLVAVLDGSLKPAPSFRVQEDAQPRRRIGLVGDLGGRSDLLSKILQSMHEREVEAAYCLGNITGDSPSIKELIGLIRKEDVLAIQGELDRQYAQGEEERDLPPLAQTERDYLARLPHVLSFRFGERPGFAFFGEYLQTLPGYSDFVPFALEMNMVCNLTRYLEDESVFPALEAMIPQFSAQVILFSQIKRWGHKRIGGVDFISLGPAWGEREVEWGLLEDSSQGLRLSIIGIAGPEGEPHDTENSR